MVVQSHFATIDLQAGIPVSHERQQIIEDGKEFFHVGEVDEPLSPDGVGCSRFLHRLIPQCWSDSVNVRVEMSVVYMGVVPGLETLPDRLLWTETPRSNTTVHENRLVFGAFSWTMGDMW